MAITNVLAMIHEVKEHIDIEIIKDIGANCVAPLNAQLEVKFTTYLLLKVRYI